MPFVKLIIGTLVLSLAFLGCQKKPKVSKDFSQLPKVSEQTKKSADSSDIFDEFYKEEGNTASKKEKVPQEESFSTGPSSYTPQFSQSGRFVVQISTVRSKAIADNLVENLNGKGYPAYTSEVQNPTPALNGTYYRVRIGSFTQVSSAKVFGENVLRPNGFDFWIDNKANDNVGLEGYGLGSSTTGAYQSPSSSSGSPNTYGTSSSTYSGSTESSWGSSSSTSTPSSSSTSSSTSTPSSSSASSSTYTPSTETSVSSTTNAASPSSAVSTPVTSTTPAANTTAPKATGASSSGSTDNNGWGSDTSSGW